MKKIVIMFGLLLMAFMLNAANTMNLPRHYGDRILICLQPDVVVEQISARSAGPVTGIASLDQLLELHEISSMEKYLPAATPDDMDGDIILSNIYRLKLSPARSSAEQISSDFRADENVLYVEPESIDRPLYTPNDTRYSQQWFLPRIQVPEAWDLWDVIGNELPGDIGIILASVDSGVEYTHPDLWQRSWINQAEVPASIFDDVDTDDDGVVTPLEVVAYVEDYNGDTKVNLQDALHTDSPFMNGIDEDNWDENATTFIDDLLGWDVSGVTSGSDADNDPMGATTGADLSTRMHGTHVAGLLCATTDNTTGISSTIYNGSLMSVKCLYDEDTNGYISGGYSGMLYAAKAGADIINLSWGGTGYSASNQSTINLIYNTYGALIVAAAGNGNDDGTPTSVPHYPSGYDNVVSVTAVNSSDRFSWANYGDGADNSQFFGVDLSAPGEGIQSTVFTTNGSYASWNGTSMASPIVASSLGLLKSVYPNATNDWLTENVVSTTDYTDDLNPDYVGQLGSGRLNIYNALAHLILPGLSYVSYSLQIVDDSGGDQLSPGGEALMRVNLLNKTNWVTASDVTAVLRSSSEFVSITDSTGAYGSIRDGNVAANLLDRYQFSISADAPAGQYPFTLVVSANADSDNPYSVALGFTVEVSFWQTNFPVATGIVTSGNAVVDLDGDGVMEIIFGASDSLLHALTPDGLELNGFPVFLNNRLVATPAVGDIDKDGDLEIVIGGLDKSLYVIQHDGSTESIYISESYIWAPATLYDLDGDNDLEIIVPTYSGDLAIMHHDGTAYEGFPLTLEDHLTSGVAIGDINRDGKVEIVFGSFGNKVHALNLDGTEISGFPIELTQSVRSAPAIANIDGSLDGSLEILFGCDDNSFHAYDANGNELWNLVSTLDIQGDPAVCDMDRDGRMEIVFGGLDRNIYALDHSGALLDGWPIITGGAIMSSPAIADIDGDGLAEIFIGSADRLLYGLHIDGSSINGFPAENSDRIQGSPTIADLDGDNDLEVIVGTDDNLAVFDLLGSRVSGNCWPTHRANLQRTGFIDNLLVSVSGGGIIPDRFALQANFPNPFNPTTVIRFGIPEANHVDLQILDIRGRILATLVSEQLTPASYEVLWNGEIDGKPASAGIYLYRLSMGNKALIGKMTLLK